MYREIDVRHDGHSLLNIAFSSKSLSIRMRGSQGPTLCTALIDEHNSLLIRLSSLSETIDAEDREYRIQHCRRSSMWQDEFRLRLSDPMAVAWKRVRDGELEIRTTDSIEGEQKKPVMPSQGDWKLVSTVRAWDAYGEEIDIREDVLAVCVKSGSSKKGMQKATMYFFRNLEWDLEVASLAALMGLEKWVEGANGKTK